MKKVSFLNKVEVVKKGGNTHPLRVISTIGIVCCSLALLASFLLDGFGGLFFSMLACLAVLLRTKGQWGRKEDYISVPTEILFEDEKMEVIYYDIDRGDSRGKRNERFPIVYSRIEKIEFSEKLQCIRLTMTEQLPFLVEWQKSNMPEQAGNFKYLFFYLLKESKDEIYQDMINYTNRMITVVE